jgi:hypothetical protein
MTKQDFEYDSYDQTAIKVAFENLRQTEKKGFYYGVFFGLPLGMFLIKSLNKTSKLPVPWFIAITVPVLTGSTV